MMGKDFVCVFKCINSNTDDVFVSLLYYAKMYSFVVYQISCVMLTQGCPLPLLSNWIKLNWTVMKSFRTLQKINRSFHSPFVLKKHHWNFEKKEVIGWSKIRNSYTTTRIIRVIMSTMTHKFRILIAIQNFGKHLFL